MGRLVGGRYRLDDKQLGSGGFGCVWLARDEQLNVTVAVKEVRLPGSAGAEEAAQRLARAAQEAHIAARIRDHPNIVAVHDVVTDDGRPWIVMRYVDGPSLAERLATGGPLATDRVTAMAVGLLSAIQTAHAAGVLHRDIKPANVMLAADGTALLTDFGIARATDNTRLTQTGQLVGSLEYMAPERLDGRDGPEADLWSLGVTLYEAVTGRSPFRRGSPHEVINAVLHARPKPLQPPGSRLARVIMGLLAKNPARRLTAEQALRLLAGVPPKSPLKVGGLILVFVLLGLLTRTDWWDSIGDQLESAFDGGDAGPGPMTNTYSGLCIASAGPQGFRLPVLAADCEDYRGQIWSYDADSDHLVNPPNNMCFDTAAAPAPGVNVVLNPCGDYPAQNWSYDADTGQVANLPSGLCLDTAGPPADNVSLVLNSCGNYTGQGWHM